MGVRGLYYYIAKVLGLKTVPHGEPLDLASVASSSRGWSRPLSDSDQAGVVFDGESLCYWATEVPWEVGNRVDSVHGGESLHMFMTFLKFFERFATEQIPICVIFDGVKLAAKKKTLLRRRRSSVVGNKAVNKSTKAALTSEMFDRSLFARSVMIEALRVISNRYPGYVLVRCALAEGDSDCVRFARELRAYAVIGNDFDFVILMAQAPEVKFISIFAIIFSGTSHRSYPEWKYQKGLSWIEFSPENCALLHSAFQEWRVGGAGKQRRVRFSQLGSGLADVVTFERSDINGRELQVRFLTYVDNKPEVFVVKRPMINCRYYDAEMIASALGVDSTSLPILATCIGSDFLPQDDLKRFHQDIGVLQQAGGWLKRSDIVPTVAAMVRQSLGESSMNSLRSEVCRMLSSSDFGIDASKVNATLDFFTLQPLREEKVIQIFLRILRLWYPLRDGYLEPNVLKILSSGGRLRCPPTMEIGRFKNIFHSNMNENMLPLMNLFVTLFDECASIVVSYYQRYMPGSIENAVVSELKLAGDRILEVVQNAGANTGCIDQVLQIVEGCDSDWSAAHAMPRDFVNEVVATGSMRHLRLPSVGSVRELIINSLALCQPTPITFPGEVVQFLLSPELRDSQFLDLCSFFSIIDMGYPKLYNQVENCFEIMKESYILSFLARNRRSLAIGTENELSEIKKTCVRLKPFHDIDSDCKNCIQSFMSALSYGHMLINQVAVIILNVLGDAFFADDSVKHWDPSFVDLIDGRFYHFIHDCISNRECDSKTSETLQELRSSDLYKTLSKAYGGQIIHYNNKGDKLSAKSAGESDSDDNVDSTSSSSDESESSDSDCDEDFALIFPRSMKTTFRLKKKEGSEHALQSSAFDTALGLLQAPLLSAQPTVESSLLPNPDLWPSHELQSASYGSASDDQAAAARLRARGDEWASKKKIAVSVNTSFGDALSEALYAPHSFQRMAFQHIEKGHCTLVLAPTGSGKTDIAICTAYQVCSMCQPVAVVFVYDYIFVFFRCFNKMLRL